MATGVHFNVVVPVTSLPAVCEWWNGRSSDKELHSVELPNGESVSIRGERSHFRGQKMKRGAHAGFEAPVVLDSNPELELQWERNRGPWNRYKTIFFKDDTGRFVLEHSEFEIYIGDTHAIVSYKPPHVTTKVEHWAVAIPELTSELRKLGECGFWLNGGVQNCELPPRRLPKVAEEMILLNRPGRMEYLAECAAELLAPGGCTPRGEELMAEYKQAKKTASQISSHWNRDKTFPAWFRDEEVFFLKICKLPLESISEVHTRVKSIKGLLNKLPNDFSKSVAAAMKKVQSHQNKGATTKYLGLEAGAFETNLNFPKAFECLSYDKRFPRVKWKTIVELAAADPVKGFVASLLVFASCQSCLSEKHAEDAAAAATLLAEIPSQTN